MAEIIAPLAHDGADTGRFREAASIRANRIFDCCRDRDCLEDLQVYFAPASQELIDNSDYVKPKSAQVMHVAFEMDAAPFNEGFYIVSVSYYFRVVLTVGGALGSNPTEVSGLACHRDRHVLYGGGENVCTFSSNGETHREPTAALRVTEPVFLDCRVCDVAPAFAEAPGCIPLEVTEAFGFDFCQDLCDLCDNHKCVLVTLGIFTIISTERSVEIMVPVYDYSVPERECEEPSNPCDMFRRLGFPTDRFFPEGVKLD